MSYVFISYSRKDRVFVDRLIADLNGAGVRTWRDVDNMIPGEDWSSALLKAVQQAQVLLFVASSHFSKIDWVAQELLVASDKSKLVIPVIVDAVETELLARLKGLQWIDFRINYTSALNQLLKALPPTVRQEESIIPEPPKSKGYVFISYAEEDAEFVLRLRDYLKKRGYGYWDYQESDRDYHSQLFLELEHVIREAAATLSILSPAWKRSKWTAKEYLFSEEVETPVFLLMAEEMGPTLVTAGIPYIDFVRDCDKGFEKLDRELKRKGLM